MRLFICTDKADEALLETLTDALDGYRMTIDIDRIIGERDSRPTLQASIQDCEAFVFALTRNTVHSRRCHWEFAQAVAHRRPIVVAQLDEIDPYPTALEPFLKADLRHEEGQSVLLDALYVAGATPPSILAQLLRNRLLLAIVVVVGILTAYLLAGPYSPYRETISDTVRGVIEVADRADFIYNPPQPTADPTLVAAQAPLQRMTLSANAEAILRSGQALARNGDYPAALQAFNRTLEISPGSVGAHIARGRALQAVDEIDAAEADFNAAVMLAPDLALVYASRATFYFETERGDAAINDANRALAINPNDVGAYITRGRAYLLRGDTANAIDSHEAALALEPENSAALTYRGEAHQVAGRLKLARADYDAALSPQPAVQPGFYPTWYPPGRRRQFVIGVGRLHPCH
jgi:tetratricopeptide (TPR) repeat protein